MARLDGGRLLRTVEHGQSGRDCLRRFSTSNSDRKATWRTRSTYLKMFRVIDEGQSWPMLILMESIRPPQNPHDLDIVPLLATTGRVAFTVQRVGDLLKSLTVAPKLLNHR